MVGACFTETLLIYTQQVASHSGDSLQAAGTLRAPSDTERTATGTVLSEHLAVLAGSCYRQTCRGGHYSTYLLTPWSRVLLEKLTSFAASQEIPRILWNPKVHYRTHKCS
jgi:hypothetical protein